jgi:hypothetical protein
MSRQSHSLRGGVSADAFKDTRAVYKTMVPRTCDRYEEQRQGAAARQGRGQHHKRQGCAHIVQSPGLRLAVLL